MDVSRYKALFLSEAGEHARGLEESLLALERMPADAGALEGAFRHAHSLKGMAGAMGYETLQGIAHAVEDLLEPIRQGAAAPAGAAEGLLASVDAMNGLLVAIAADQPTTGVDAGPLIERLRLLAVSAGGASARPVSAARSLNPAIHALHLNGAFPPNAEVPIIPSDSAIRAGAVRAGAAGAPAAEQTASFAAVSSAAASAASSAGQQPLEIQVLVSPRCSAPSVRAFIVYRRLCALGEVSRVHPSVESIRAGEFGGTLELRLCTVVPPHEVERLLGSIPDLERFTVRDEDALRAAAPRAGLLPSPSAERLPMSPRAPAPLQQRTQSPTVRVRTELLDRFMDSLTDLLLAKAHLAETALKLDSRDMQEGVGLLERAVRAVHDRVMEARLLAMQNLTERLPRLVRDLAVRRGKRVRLEIAGADVEVDRAVVEALDAPLLHLVRNAVDHGLESPEERVRLGKQPDGLLRVAARRERGEVVIELSDDGRGIDVARLRRRAVELGLVHDERVAAMDDREALYLVCLPGLSTAEELSELSGRGVGMDAVKSAVESLGGRLEIASELGVGTRFVLRLPITVSVVNVLAVREGLETYAFATTKVERTLLAPAERLVDRDERLRYVCDDGEILPVYRLGRLLGLGTESPLRWPLPLLVVATEQGPAALAVDALLGQREVVLRPLGRLLERLEGLSGITIFGDGRPVFLLDGARLLRGGAQ